MLNSTTEATQAAAVNGGNGSGNDVAVDAELFTKELQSRMGADSATAATAAEKIAAAMEKLAGAMPGYTITNQPISTFGEVNNYYISNDTTNGINISGALLEQMADDDELFGKVTEMLGSVFEAGNQQNLVNANGNTTTRNIVMDNLQLRYVEVQRNAQGAALSVASLALETQKMIADTLDTLLGNRQNQSRNNNTFTSLLSMLNNNNNSNSSKQSSNTNWGFNNLVSGTSAWRLQVNAASTNTATQMLQSSQSFAASLEVIIERYEGEGGSETGMDLWTYMEMNQLCDPIVLDLGGEGINLTSAEDGVYFDIKGDGTPVQTAFIQGNNAFLYLDENGNGVADDVNELFGDTGGYSNGYEKLRQYDDNGDGVIDENDAIYDQLRLWRDLNGDGVNQLDESMSLAEAGVKSLNLNYEKTYEMDASGNVIGERSSFTKADGSEGLMADVWLKHK